MVTVSQRSKSVKPTRTIRLAVPPGPGCPNFVVVISVGKRSTDYHVSPIASDFGRAFRVEKVFTPDPEVYHVCLNGKDSHCDCKGFTFAGRCKHVDGLATLAQAGRI